MSPGIRYQSGVWRVACWPFIYPMICNAINTTLCVQESDLGAIHSFKTTVREQLVIRFKLESDGLAESIPVVACLLDFHLKHL